MKHIKIKTEIDRECKHLGDWEIVPRDFYLENTVDVAQKLLGKVLILSSSKGNFAGRIIETEAYCQDDPACHASKGKTRRNAQMFGQPGTAYVYFTYGFHYCLNAVTQPAGIAEAVLIRSLFPLQGVEMMREHRQRQVARMLCNGPGKLTQAFGIDLEHNGADLTTRPFLIADDGYAPGKIVAKPRIGITQGVENLWRFYPASLKDWVSKP